MAYNKIVKEGTVLIDLTADTITAESLEKGKTAHDKAGEVITGTSTKDSDTTDATVAEAEILVGKTAYARGAKLTGTMANVGGQDITIASKDEVKTISTGYHDGSGTVGIDEVEKSKLVAENIRQGVTVLGVKGAMSGLEDVITETKSATPTFKEQKVIASPGKYMTEVTIKAIPYSESLNSAGGTTATIG